MLVDSSNSGASAAVTGAIRQASNATGTSFNYLLATAKVESGLNPQAGASTTSARGLFQFIEQTWLATMKQAGPSLGYANYAAAITQTASGGYEVKNATLRSAILKLRNDPTANALMAGAFTKANAAVLSDRLGRSPSEAELYIAHFLGAGGAAQLLTLAAANPNATAADFFPNAAHSNPSIFYDRSTGAARSVAQVRNVLTARYDVACRNPGRSAAMAQDGGTTAAAAPDTAGITNAFAAAIPTRAADDNQIFHGLFADGTRAASVAPVVSALWNVSNASGAAAATPASAVKFISGTLDLFKDPPRNS